ncbi:hypothetical protein VTK73DRAFT_10264 [Phialemonium thermophilum]|uniref:Uncharacterized protein n=1 Tax=Phialemonium thermophilum TaxID=223376 RepID=A0ABR3VXL3_9PEZI
MSLTSPPARAGQRRNRWVPSLESLFEGLEKQRRHFTKSNTIEAAHRKSLDQTNKLLEDERLVRSTPLRGALARHRAARAVLMNILHGLDHDAFVLCIFSLSISWLGAYQATKPKFVQELQSWWSRVPRPKHISDLVPSLAREYPGLGKALADCRCGFGHGAGAAAAGSHGGERTVRFRGEIRELINVDSEGEAEAAVVVNTSRVSGRSPGEASNGRQEAQERRAVKEEPGTNTMPPMEADVYKVDQLEAIRVVASSRELPVLMLPRFVGPSPFIRIPVTEETALQLIHRAVHAYRTP